MKTVLPKIIILGSTGFVGSALLDIFESIPDIEVLGLSSSTLDLSKDHAVKELGKIITRNTVIICTVRASKDLEQFESFQKDTAIIKNIGRVLSQNQVRKCIYLSGGPVYDDNKTDLNITEESPIAPTSLYAAAKLAGENILRIVGKQTGIPVLILRPCKIYGPGGSDYGPDSFIKSLILNEKVRLFGDGTEKRNHLYVGDLAELIKRFAFNTAEGTYNLVSGSYHTYTDILAYLRILYKQDFEVEEIPRTRKKVDLNINMDKLKSSIPDFIFTPIEKGLEQTFYFSLDKLNKEGK